MDQQQQQPQLLEGAEDLGMNLENNNVLLMQFDIDNEEEEEEDNVGGGRHEVAAESGDIPRLSMEVRLGRHSEYMHGNNLPQNRTVQDENMELPSEH